MFLFRCCTRVDCGCQSESETEVSRSSHSTCDYLHQSEKQIQRRLLPQPATTSCTKHFVDYSGCSRTTPSRSLLVDSTQNIDYEEVLCVSVLPRRECSELNYACVNDNVICKPPCSIGVVNNNFSPDTSGYNNNSLEPQFSDSVKSVKDGGPCDGSGSNGSSDVSSAGSSVDDHNSAEVKYVADIRQFQSTQTDTRPHGDDCCCPSCQCEVDDINPTEYDELIHHSADVKCSCKSCRDFYSRMQSANTDTGLTASSVGVHLFSHQYRLMSRIAQVPLTTLSKLSAVHKIDESTSFGSQNVPRTRESASTSTNHSDLVFRAFAPEEVDDDDGLSSSSSDDELHYVFHKFIDNSCLEEPFTDDRLRSSAVGNNEHGAELDYTSVRTEDDLEVAFFMVGNISPGSPSAVFPDVAPTVPTSITESTGQKPTVSEDAATSESTGHKPTVSEDAATSTGHKTTVSEDAVTSESTGHKSTVSEVAATSTGHEPTVSEDTVSSAAEFTVCSYNIDYCAHESLADADNGAQPDSFSIVCKDIETDTLENVYEASTSSISLTRLENFSGALTAEASELETDFYVDSNLNVRDNENQPTYSESDGTQVRRDIIVQELSDSSSLFIELPAADIEQVFADAGNISIPTSARICAVEEPAAAAAFDVVEEQSVMRECVTEDAVRSSQDDVIDADYGQSHNQLHTTAYVAAFIDEIVADAVQQIADDSASGSVRICSVASEDEDISTEWPKQILITNAPVTSVYHRLTTDDECDNSSNTAASDVKLQLSNGDSEYLNVTAADIGVVDTDSDSSEAVCMTGSEAEHVPQVENYLISYDVHLLRQLADDDADASVGQTLVWSSHSTCPDKSVAIGDVKLQDLVQPLEYTASESGQDSATSASDSQNHLSAGRQDAGQAASDVGFSQTDIVEDFFMQYVVPVDSVVYGVEAVTAASVAVHGQQAEDQPKVDEDEDLVQTEKFEITAEKMVDIVIRNAVAETEVDVAATSSVVGVQCEDAVDEREDDHELETAAETVVNVIVSDVTSATPSPVPVASGDTQLVVPTTSSCLLHSPSESHRKKSVHFADTHGLQLETVQHYDQTPQPKEPLASLEDFLSKLSAAAAERRAKWTESHPSHASSWLCSSSVYLLACFELASSQEELLERIRQCHVALESCSFDDLALAISGVVRVSNIAFHKKILVRYSVDRWTTRTDVDGEYIPRSNDGPTDRFSFTIILPSRKQFAVGSEVQFAICFTAGDGPNSEFWDNNHGRNYVVRYCSKAASKDVDNADDCDGGNVNNE